MRAPKRRPKRPVESAVDFSFFLRPVSMSMRWLVLASTGLQQPLIPTARVELDLDYGALDVDFGMALDAISRRPLQEDNSLIVEIAHFVGDVAPCVGAAWEAVTVRGCGVGQVGILRGRTLGFDVDGDQTVPWLAGGLRAAVDVKLVPELAIVIQGEGLIPVLRTQFLDGRSLDVLGAVPSFTGSVGVGAALQLR